MKTTLPYADEIRQRFAAMQSKEELCDLLNFVIKAKYGENKHPIRLKSLSYYAHPDYCERRYQRFTVRKKSGGERVIHAPNRGLKRILRALNLVFQAMYPVHPAAMGFVPGKSVTDNASLHTGQAFVYNLDLKDFFHSFDRNQVKMALYRAPFNLRTESREKLAFLIASLCTHRFEVNGEQQYVLPQGSPASPVLTNILCSALDRRLNGLAKRFNLKYSRYADDITFSGGYSFLAGHMYQPNKNRGFLEELHRLIEQEHKLVIHPEKVRIQRAAVRQEVTGLVVNEKPNVHRRYVKRLRQWLHVWERQGYEQATTFFHGFYAEDKGHVKNNPKPLLENVLGGKLAYLKMVKGSDNATFQKLWERFVALVATTPETAGAKGHGGDLGRILDIWEKQGIEAAMEAHSRGQ